MNIKPWMKNLTPDNMPNDELKLVAEFLGIDTTLELMDALSGCVINIPKYGFRKAREAFIIRNYDGTKMSRLKLSIECGVTESYIRELAKKHRIKEAE